MKVRIRIDARGRRLIAGIKAVRELTGLNLKDAKDVIDRIPTSVEAANVETAQKFISEMVDYGFSVSIAEPERPKTVTVMWDWKEQPVSDDGAGPLGEALRDFGVYLTPLPSDEGSDQYGFVITARELTRDELERVDAERMGMDLETYRKEVLGG